MHEIEKFDLAEFGETAPHRPRAQGYPYQGPVCMQTFQELLKLRQTLPFQAEIHQFHWSQARITLSEAGSLLLFGARRNCKLISKGILLKIYSEEWVSVKADAHLEVSKIEIANWSWIIFIPQQAHVLDETSLRTLITNILSQRNKWKPRDEIYLHKGPEYTVEIKKSIEGYWQIDPNSNSMGVRLRKSILANDFNHKVAIKIQSPKKKDADIDTGIASSPVFPGVIQWTPNGPIVLMHSCQTHGGYQRVAYVLEQDLERLIQLRPGEWIRLLF